MKNKAYILGGAQTDFERNWTKEGKSVIALLKEVIMDGLSDSNISLDEIQSLNKENRVACFVGNFIAEHYIHQGHLGGLLTEVDSAFYGVPSARYEAACASGSAALDAGITKIQNGDYDVAIILGWELMKTVDSQSCGDILGCAALYEQESNGVEFPFPKLFGQLADYILLKYNLEENRFMDNLAMLSVKNYENAKRNHSAQTRKWFMSYQQANDRGSKTNPIVGNKLASSDCSQITDGAAIVVVVSEQYLREKGIVTKPVVKGYGHRVAPMSFSNKMDDAKSSEYILPWTRQTVIDAYKRSGLTVENIDFFETHDCFTSSEFAAISSFGITKPGEEYKAIETGDIFFDGRIPINPSGGLIGCGHPVGATGVRMFLDLYKQVSQKADNYQVENANNGLMLNIGGSATTNYVFIVGNDD
ncbi:MAG: acetyl-CoA acetyltransferase [Clostridiales bacterium]